MKILIVEDNEQVRLLLRDYLSTLRAEICECGDGSEALACFQKYRPDWVLMDWEMPVMNGIAATREIVARFPNARICLVTAFDDEAVHHAALEAGASDIVLKDNLFELEKILGQQPPSA